MRLARQVPAVAVTIPGGGPLLAALAPVVVWADGPKVLLAVVVARDDVVDVGCTHYAHCCPPSTTRQRYLSRFRTLALMAGQLAGNRVRRFDPSHATSTPVCT